MPSACLSLIAVDEGSKIVQFSSPGVKEFLTSHRLKTLYSKDISRYHISLETAHAALSRACVDVLLRLDETVDKVGHDSPLASYAVEHWVEHTQFGNVASINQNNMECLFDPSKPHLAWIWMCDIGMGQNPTMDDRSSNPRAATPLYYAALYGFSGLISQLVAKRPEDLNAKGGYYGTPLHAASYKGHADAAHALIDAEADVKATNGNKTPLHAAFYGGQREAMRLLLGHGADVDARDSSHNTLLHQASLNGQADVVELLLDHGADAKASNQNGWTPLHRAALCGRVEVVARLLAKGAEVNAQSWDKNTPLHIGSMAGKLGVVRQLLEHGAEVDIRGEHNRTPLEAARARGHDDIAKLLSKGGHQGRLNMMRRRISVAKGSVAIAAGWSVSQIGSMA